MIKNFLSIKIIRRIVRKALEEDIGLDRDITSNLLANNINKELKLVSNQKGIIGGLEFAKQTFKIIDKKIKFTKKIKEGSYVKKGDVIAIIKGNIKNILTAERVSLNFLSHISGVATKTNQFVRKAGKKCKICCTRKTIPNFRIVQKYGVKLGGGTNHRFSLSDEYFIKDNHIAYESIDDLIIKANKFKNKKIITVEVDNLNQLKKILGMNFNRILFDNFNLKNLKKAVKLSKKYYQTEASGNVTLKNVKKIAATGVNRISIGQLTHSVTAIDLKLEI